MALDTSKLESMRIETFIGAARQHGEDDEPDHEVGDLQQMLRAAWNIMTPGQRQEFASSPVVLAVLEAGYPSEFDESGR
jgi:hypothetical protein